MKNTIVKTSFPNGYELSHKIEPSVAARLVDMKKGSPIRLQNNGASHAILVEKAHEIISVWRVIVCSEFCEKNHKFISVPEKFKLDPEFDPEGFKNLKNEAIKPLEDFIQLMETSSEPLQLVSLEHFENALSLVEPKAIANLLSRYWVDLPGGKKLLEEANNEFEAICAKYKIPRRTSAIISRNK